MKCINLKSIIQKFSDFYLKKQEKVELEYLKIMIFPRKESELETACMTFNALHFKRPRQGPGSQIRGEYFRNSVFPTNSNFLNP